MIAPNFSLQISMNRLRTALLIIAFTCLNSTSCAKQSLILGAPTKLENTEWVATRINGDAVKGNAPTLTIEGDRSAFRAYGSSGCNRYTGQATLGDKSGLQFGPLASTRMACPGDTDRQEAAYLKALQSVTSYHLNQGDLILLDKDFNKVLEFKVIKVIAKD